MIIPYFGKKPSYFDLWLLSARNNPEFMFLFYSDCDLEIGDAENVKVNCVSWEELVCRFKQKLGNDICLDKPYKLCDYKPTYGYVFNEDISDYDFWGFCDVDLLFGDLKKYITNEMLQKYDKLFYHGHFCLIRNNAKMNMLFKAQYDKIIDWKYSLYTPDSCHFDENGTIAYAFEFEKNLRFYFKWVFFDPPAYQYKMMRDDKEVCAVWSDGVLTMYWDNGRREEEIMYIHLQKRMMYDETNGNAMCIGVYRDEFVNMEDRLASELLQTPVDMDREALFYQRVKKKKKDERKRLILHGGIKTAIMRRILHWRNEIDFNLIQ